MPRTTRAPVPPDPFPPAYGRARLTMVVEYETGPGAQSLADIVEAGKELVEKARELGGVITADLVNLPSTMSLV